ncbi:hypothetical protein [Chromobacterium rhizoryzae]|uniref:Uncharacterized protein n=1 Tax=Chromobacterium rhizoryzae TaxID=1778675 RepID=A0AAD0RS92_9NEIS|nr:hypothetical protein [Chromobacterium rhizoryzae]AXT47687.1 hypothetical protein D1345_16530 [Chromobacterium rhizoryzae]
MKDGIPIITANAKPFRFVCRGENDAWSPSLDEVNSRSYDYVKLHRMSAYLDAGIAPFSLGVCFDGTLVLPAIELYRDREAALAKFNQTLVELLVGGLYCEAAGPDDIGYGFLSMEGYSRVLGGADGPAAAVHKAARMKMLGTLENIHLLSPEIVTAADLETALKKGRSLLTRLGPVPQEQILYGATFYVRKQWAESLLHLWTTTERLVETAWSQHVLTYPVSPSKKRRAFLEDHRTWTVSAKLEVLHQKGLLPAETYEELDEVRKARNNFAHRGTAPGHGLANKALRACFEMASLCASEFKERNLFSEVVELIDARCRPELYPKKTRFESSEVTHWLAIPPIPGDENWGDAPYEVIEEFRLRPIEGAA